MRNPIGVAFVLAFASSFSAFAQSEFYDPFWDGVTYGPSTSFEVIDHPGSICHLVTFEGAAQFAQIYPNNGHLVPGTPIQFNPNWVALVGIPAVQNNPSGTTVVLATSGPSSVVAFDLPVSRVSLFYAALTNVTLEVLDENEAVLGSVTGAANVVTGFNQWDPLSLDLGENVIHSIRLTRASGTFMIDDLDVCMETDPDTDMDGLTDSEEAALGTDPNNPDSDGDGLLDGTEVDMQQTSTVLGCPDPLNSDSDNDTLLDGAEVTLGTSACDADTDGDGLPDPTDPLPTIPDTSSGVLEDAALALANYIENIDLALVDAPNENSARGRINSLTSRVRNAAKQIAKGKFNAAASLLEGVQERVDGDPQQKDWILPSPQAGVILSTLAALLSLLS